MRSHRGSAVRRPEPLTDYRLEDDDAAEYGRHVHHEGHDKGEFRYLPCICNPPHKHCKHTSP